MLNLKYFPTTSLGYILIFEIFTFLASDKCRPTKLRLLKAAQNEIASKSKQKDKIFTENEATKFKINFFKEACAVDRELRPRAA